MNKIDPKSLGKVVVVYGGKSAEREVSLISGSGVINALKTAGVDVYCFDPKENSLDQLTNGGYDRAFLILHGKGGEDGIIQGLMEYIGLPYTGSGVYASAVGIDKIATKSVWMTEGIPVPKGMVLQCKEDCAKAIETLGKDLIVKPSKEGSSIGLYKLKDATVETLQEAYQKAQEKGMQVMVEEFVYGRELTVAVLDMLDGEGLRALPIIEIKAPDGDYDFEHKYFSDETVYECPAVLSEELTQKIQETVVKAANSLGISGWSRIDVMLKPDGTFKLLEINTAPGMTPHSLVPLAARTVGIDYEELVKLVALGASLQG